MSTQAIRIDELPTSSSVVDTLKAYFAKEDIDLRDITSIARQDPVVLANILFLVNQVYLKRGTPVVKTLSAAINLVGLEPLKQKLLAIKSLNAEDPVISCYELVRSRIYVASCLTQFWADYMGQTSAEEMYCASMFTGLGDLCYCLSHTNNHKHSQVDFESIETVQTLYCSDQSEIDLMPDSIQIIYQNQLITDRLKLSILVYELVACLELGYSTERLTQALSDLCEYVGIGIHRAGYDLARQLVQIERSATYHSFFHSKFLVATNMEVTDPISLV